MHPKAQILLTFSHSLSLSVSSSLYLTISHSVSIPLPASEYLFLSRSLFSVSFTQIRTFALLYAHRTVLPPSLASITCNGPSLLLRTLLLNKVCHIRGLKFFSWT